ILCTPSQCQSEEWGRRAQFLESIISRELGSFALYEILITLCVTTYSIIRNGFSGEVYSVTFDQRYPGFRNAFHCGLYSPLAHCPTHNWSSESRLVVQVRRYFL